MKTLHRLVHSLNEHEWDILIKFLTVFPNKNEPWKKILALAKLIREEKDETLSARVYSERISGKTSTQAVIRIGQMLRNKILESLTLDVNLNSTNDEFVKNDSNYMLIQLRKKSLQYHRLVFARATSAIAEELLDETIKLAKEYEFYKILIDYLSNKQAFCLTMGVKQYDKVQKDLVYYKKCNDADNIAHEYLMKLKRQSNLIKNTDLIPLLKKGVKVLKGLHRQFGIKTVLYILKQYEQEYSVAKKDYANARKICFEILDLVQNCKAIRTRRRIGIAYAQISQVSVYLKSFNDSISYARKSLEYFPNKSRNYLYSKETEFYGLFYGGFMSQAQECTDYIMRYLPVNLSGSFHHAQINFYRANTFFMQSHFKDALKILDTSMDISQDKSGWEIGIRILRIMTNIELGNTLQAERQIESLRKFFNYVEKQKNKISPRNRIILNLLMHLSAHNFEFHHFTEKGKKNLIHLRSKREGYAWNFFTPEMIPFHSWIDKKLVA